jgi:enoyl-CoA hydratase
MTGDSITGARAVEIGLATRVLPGESLMPGAMDLAHRLARMPDDSVQVMKRSINYRWEVAGLAMAIGRDLDGFVQNKLAMGPVQTEFRKLSREIGSRAAIERLGIDLDSWTPPDAAKPSG